MRQKFALDYDCKKSRRILCKSFLRRAERKMKIAARRKQRRSGSLFYTRTGRDVS